MKEKSGVGAFSTFIIIFLWISVPLMKCNAFVSSHNLALDTEANGQKSMQVRNKDSQLNGLFGAGNKADQTNNDDDDDSPAIKQIFTIECESIKQGALRFALGLYLIGQQNTPTKGSWVANQDDDGKLNMYYTDATGMFSVTISDNLIVVDRHGSMASLTYMLQESVLLHGFLDELESLATGDSNPGDDTIKDEDRLLVLTEPNIVFDKARSVLPARAAES